MTPCAAATASSRAGTSIAARRAMPVTRTLALAGILMASLAAQAPTFTTFGNPCISLGPPLTALNLPRIGQVFQLQVLSSQSVQPGSYDGFSTTSVLLAGLSNTSWRGIPLPWTPPIIQTMGAGACGDLSVSAESTLYLPYAFPRVPVVVSLPIPNAPALVGTSVYFQTVDLMLSRFFTLGLVMGVAGQAQIGV
jgi:hypothetical protein